MGVSFNVHGYVRYDGETLSGAAVSIYVDGSYVTAATTDDLGYYSRNIYISTIGSHTLKASALGVSASRSILITYTSVVFSVSISAPSSVEEGISFTVSGTVKDQYGYGYGGVTVKLYKSDSLFASILTGSDGSYSKSTSIGTAGTYTLKAVADSKQATRSITVTTPPPPPPPQLAATLVASPTTGNAPLAVTFTIGISGGYTPYTWTLNYGDGSTPSSGTVAGTKAHTYVKVGTFTVTLTVTDALGASAVKRATASPGGAAPPTASAIGVAAPLAAGIVLIVASQHR